MAAQTIAVSGGTTPCTRESEELLLWPFPSGLSLNMSTGEITGTPTSAGTFTFAVQVSDFAGASIIQVLSITVNDAPTDNLPSE